MLKHTFRVALITLFSASMMTACDGGGDKKTEDKKVEAGDKKLSLTKVSRCEGESPTRITKRTSQFP